MTKKLVASRMSDHTRGQLRELAPLVGGQSGIIALAIDRLYTQLKRVEMDTIRMDTIRFVKAETFRRNLHITTAKDTLSAGYEVMVTLAHDGHEVTYSAFTPLVYREQSEKWCQEHCQAFIESIPAEMTPGEALRKFNCYYSNLRQLSIDTPPEQKRATDAQCLEYNRRTGRPGIALHDDNYQEWARQYNAWIMTHPELAADYGCTIQDATMRPAGT